MPYRSYLCMFQNFIQLLTFDECGHDSDAAQHKHGGHEDVTDEGEDHEGDVRNCSKANLDHLQDSIELYCIVLYYIVLYCIFIECTTYSIVCIFY